MWGKLPNQTNSERRRLQHKLEGYLVEFLIGNPKVRTKNAVDCLTETFENFRLKETSIR